MPLLFDLPDVQITITIPKVFGAGIILLPHRPDPSASRASPYRLEDLPERYRLPYRPVHKTEQHQCELHPIWTDQ